MALNNVPLSGQTLNETRDPIRNNFTAIETGLAVDHVELTVPSAGNAGKHKGIHIVDGVPSPAIGATEIGLHNLVTVGVPALLLTNGAATAIDITTLTGNATQGSITLPSGLIVKWGNDTTAASGLLTTNFTSAFTTVFAVYTTVSEVGGTSSSGSSDAYVRVYNYTTALFSVVGFRLNTARDRKAVPFG